MVILKAVVCCSFELQCVILGGVSNVLQYHIYINKGTDIETPLSEMQYSETALKSTSSNMTTKFHW